MYDLQIRIFNIFLANLMGLVDEIQVDTGLNDNYIL